MPGKLIIVPTPVGNLDDMTPRAVEALRTASLVLCEDTRTSGVLLRHFGITTPTASHHKYNEHSSLDPVVDRIEAGETIALVSDAGTPGISDPGFMLSRRCRERGVTVETLPGPTAFVPALVDSGLPCDRFYFEGFLPQKKGRATRLEILAAMPVTFIIYESPLRLARTLAQLAEACGGDR
ncbi:MAG: 16S rRNA (cytidine(1402)-2'-O)-methyltransferase, partial [Muribaculaceae bacterium]|nr:16S rRNA (cytidine(1402)-2'-O)-methyltransferase [Muribaculaceae bacterium]